MNHSFFDWHCDTAAKMCRTGQGLSVNDFDVSLERARVLQRYVQVMAYFTSSKMNNEDGWRNLIRMHRHLSTDPAVSAGNAVICTSCPSPSTPVSLLLAVEDARVLNGRIERLDALYRMGVRVITPLWSGVTCIGGAHNSDQGLTEFGAQTVRRVVSLGMLPDVSHASEASAEEIFEIACLAGRPVIASHSNAYGVCPVSRNLRDGQIQSILKLGGIIGINLYRAFLSKDPENACRNDVLRHAEYFLERGAEKALCFGCDMDGADLPQDLSSLEAIPSLADFLLNYYSDKTVERLLFQNAYSFAERALPPSVENP